MSEEMHCFTLRGLYRSRYFGQLSSYIKILKKTMFYYSDYNSRFVTKNVPSILVFYKTDWFHQFCSCIDIIAYDIPGSRYRYTVIYYLLSLVYNARAAVLTQTTALGGADTVSAIYSSALWSEREVWDMLGVLIHYHPDLRRLLTDYGFQWFPLRKDFPVSGFVEVGYYRITNAVAYKKVELAQAIRIDRYL